MLTLGDSSKVTSEYRYIFDKKIDVPQEWINFLDECQRSDPTLAGSYNKFISKFRGQESHLLESMQHKRALDICYLRLVKLVNEFDGVLQNEHVKTTVERTTAKWFAPLVKADTSSLNDYEPWARTDIKEYDDFLKMLNGYLRFQGEDNYTLRNRLLCGYLLGRCNYLIEYSKTDTRVFYKGASRNLMMNALLHYRRILLGYFDAEKQIKIQELLGDSGVGKSKSVMNIKYYVHALTGIPTSEVVYKRANDYWWNGYKGQPIILYDDFTHSNKLKFDLKLELIAVGSGTFSNPPMAFEKEAMFTSSHVFITSNISILDLKMDDATKSALKRRISVSKVTPTIQGAFNDNIHLISGFNLSQTFMAGIGNTLNLLDELRVSLEHTSNFDIALQCDNFLLTKRDIGRLYGKDESLLGDYDSEEATLNWFDFQIKFTQ